MPTVSAKSKSTLRSFLLAGATVVFVVTVEYLLGVHPANRMHWPRKLAECQAVLGQPGSPEQRFYALTKAQMAAFECSQYDAARSYAQEVLELAPRFGNDWNYGNAVHNGHVVLGRLAVVRGDLETACRELLLAGQTPGSPQLDSFGPNMTLARDLLAHSRRTAVLGYFQECRKFWKHDFGDLTKWEIMVRLHLPPDFGANLYY
jgi:hypothetical protein